MVNPTHQASNGGTPSQYAMSSTASAASHASQRQLVVSQGRYPQNQVVASMRDPGAGQLQRYNVSGQSQALVLAQDAGSEQDVLRQVLEMSLTTAAAESRQMLEDNARHEQDMAKAIRQSRKTAKPARPGRQEKREQARLLEAYNGAQVTRSDDKEWAVKTVSKVSSQSVPRQVDQLESDISNLRSSLDELALGGGRAKNSVIKRLKARCQSIENDSRRLVATTGTDWFFESHGDVLPVLEKLSDLRNEVVLVRDRVNDLEQNHALRSMTTHDWSLGGELS